LAALNLRLGEREGWLVWRKREPTKAGLGPNFKGNLLGGFWANWKFGEKIPLVARVGSRNFLDYCGGAKEKLLGILDFKGLRRKLGRLVYWH